MVRYGVVVSDSPRTIDVARIRGAVRQHLQNFGDIGTHAEKDSVNGRKAKGMHVLSSATALVGILTQGSTRANCDGKDLPCFKGSIMWYTRT